MEYKFHRDHVTASELMEALTLSRRDPKVSLGRQPGPKKAFIDPTEGKGRIQEAVSL